MAFFFTKIFRESETKPYTMAGKTNDTINLLIKAGNSEDSRVDQRLDPGPYSHFQVVKTNAGETSSPVQIEIIEGTQDVVSLSAIETYKRVGGNFRESMPEIAINGDRVTVKLRSDAALAADAKFQVIFFKAPICNA